MCPNGSLCTYKSCDKIHPKTCRDFSQKGECIYNEKCAYAHKQQENLKIKFNETVLFLISRNQQVIEALKEKVNELQN